MSSGIPTSSPNETDSSGIGPIASVRRALLSGLLLITPLVVTLYVLNLLITNVGGPFSGVFFLYLPEEIRTNPRWSMYMNIAATFKVVVILILLGYLSRYLAAKTMVNLSEKIIERLPFVNTVYSSVKQIVSTFSAQQRAVFQKVVMLEYPRKGTWALGFLTSQAKGEAQAKTSRQLCNIFVPTTPNPTSGFLLLVPEEDVIELNMSIGEGMKLIISGGAVVPPYPRPEKPSLSAPKKDPKDLP
ncbi:MAG: DUF502 domain-containing protein [Opitutales bacterium]|nr:DUF502 domain-containing protein [Opitutales bacterium]MCH8541754.1 DUF502 domain-containing protein [Opitutales bacterium]